MAAGAANRCPSGYVQKAEGWQHRLEGLADTGLFFLHRSRWTDRRLAEQPWSLCMAHSSAAGDCRSVLHKVFTHYTKEEDDEVMCFIQRIKIQIYLDFQLVSNGS